MWSRLAEKAENWKFLADEVVLEIVEPDFSWLSGQDVLIYYCMLFEF